jgi:hypothetical protein
MTHQISDVLRYGRNTEYSLVGRSEDILAAFVLRHYGFQNAGGWTFCYRGCYGQYAVENHYLYVNFLGVFEPDRPHPKIGDVVPKEDDVLGLISYQGIHEKLPFTGRLAVGSPFIPNSHMPNPSDYAVLLLLNFENGCLERANSLSEEAARIRGRITEIQHDLAKETSTQNQRDSWRKEIRKLEHEAWDLVRDLHADELK